MNWELFAVVAGAAALLVSLTCMFALTTLRIRLDAAESMILWLERDNLTHALWRLDTAAVARYTIRPEGEEDAS